MPGRRPVARRPIRRRARTGPRTVRRVVRRELRRSVEVKRHQDSWDEAGVSTLNQDPDGHIRNITRIPQGTAKTQRIGNQVTFIGLLLRGVLRNNSTGTNMVRIMVIRPRNTSLTLDSSLLESGDADTPVTTGQTGLNAMYASPNKENYTILWDKVYSLAAGQLRGDTVIIRKFFKMRSKAIWNSATLAEPTKGAIKICVFSAEAADDTSTGTLVEFSGVASLYYTDM